MWCWIYLGEWEESELIDFYDSFIYTNAQIGNNPSGVELGLAERFLEVSFLPTLQFTFH